MRWIAPPATTSLERCAGFATTATNHWYSTPGLSVTPWSPRRTACTPLAIGGWIVISSAGGVASLSGSVVVMVSSTGFVRDSDTYQYTVGLSRVVKPVSLGASTLSVTGRVPTLRVPPPTRVAGAPRSGGL